MDNERQLIEQMQKFPVVDTHEHTPPEHIRVKKQWDIFTLMFEHYISGDLLCAGLSNDALAIVEGNTASVGEKWRLLRDIWPLARQTTYGRVITLALREFFGEHDFADGGAERATEKLKEHNVPGLYRKVLKDTCGIKRVLTQRTGFLEQGEDDIFTLVVRPPGLGFVDRNVVEAEEQRTGTRLKTLEDFLQSVRSFLKNHAEKGTVGFKVAAWNMGLPEPAAYELAATIYGMNRFPPLKRPTVREAEGAFKRLMNSPHGEVISEDHWLLCGATMHFLAETAKELDIVMAVHSGPGWTSWIDFRLYHPLHLVPLLRAHPETRFDIYHAGLPWPRELAMIAKLFPNTWLNLTWAHIVSPEMTVSFLDELLDLIPPNKILGFGGDYGYCVENVYGHLMIARENIARVLNRRMQKGVLDKNNAVRIARLWLWDNPIDLYHLSACIP